MTARYPAKGKGVGPLTPGAGAIPRGTTPRGSKPKGSHEG